MTNISECTCKGARTIERDNSTHVMTCTGCKAQVHWKEEDADDLPF